MTDRLNPRDVEKIIASDKRIIRALADIAEAKLSPPPQRLSLRKPTPVKTPTKTSTPTTAKDTTVKLTPRAKPTPRKVAPKHRAPVTPKPKARVRIEIARGADLPPQGWTPLTMTRAPKIAASAHDLEKGVAAPCFTCGGESDKIEAQWGPFRRHEDCLQITQPWQRIHAAALHFGIDVTADEALLASTSIDVPDFGEEHSTTYTENDRDRSPWSHVDRKALSRAIVAARMTLAEDDEAGPCDLGACAWCGVERSVSWSDYGHVRHDNTRAPLCSDCGPVFDRLPGLPFDRWADQRPGVSEALTGVSPDIMETVPPALKAHAEVGGGDGEPWSHLPVEAVEAYRWSVWGRYGGTHAPEEHRAEAVARAEKLEADRGARLHAQETSDEFGFSGSEPS